MQLKVGTKVFTADGKKVGSIDRIVIEPDTSEVTHLVIQEGFLFKESKVIPMSLVGPATEDQVILRKNEDELEEFPNFQESHFVSAERGLPSVPATDNHVRTLYWYPPLGISTGLAGPPAPRYVVKTENIPEGTVALAEGANVICSDGEHVGDVERIYTDSQEDQITHLLIAEGLFLKEKKLIPVRWIAKAFEHEIRLSVDSNLVENLPEYQLQE
ncbi:MAG: PRC-barrel domain-containing protein [Anaerolineales bacterium]|jgi:sporulation protein YlmC with PRC-barrel domain